MFTQECGEINSKIKNLTLMIDVVVLLLCKSYFHVQSLCDNPPNVFDSEVKSTKHSAG